jgi:transketolase
MAALMRLPVIYVWSHDSIGLGEDGPTHQPIEHIASLRAIPRLAVVRPADANETAVAWRTLLRQNDRPACLLLSRQELPVLDRGRAGDVDGVARGAYVVADPPDGRPEVIFIGTGSEVHLALQAFEVLAAEGIGARVVSMPCVEWFLEQDEQYRQTVLPPGIAARVSVEAGIAMGWREFVGDTGEIVALSDYGASAPGHELYTRFGLTTDRLLEAARASMRKAATDDPTNSERHRAHVRRGDLSARLS